MNVQAFYTALARVLSERTETEIKVEELLFNITEEEKEFMKERRNK